MNTKISSLNIKLFADGADIDNIIKMNAEPYIKGLTTNPTLMRKAGITNYKAFALEVLTTVKEKPISFEVFSDDVNQMKLQGAEIGSWGENVFVKIPITTTSGISTAPVIEYLTSRNIKVNITAVMTVQQILNVMSAINPEISTYISVFAGRIADTGIDPLPIVSESLDVLKNISKNCELIWASPRELLNIFQADSAGCHIITATNEILSKLKLLGYDLNVYSLDTVKMFYKDAQDAGYSL
jgi:transaldolase